MQSVALVALPLLAFLWSMALRGGIRQRLAKQSSASSSLCPREDEDESDPDASTQDMGSRKRGGTNLKEYFKGMFKVGRSSAPEVVEGAHAAAAKDDSMAQLGKYKTRGNMSRDVVAHLGKESSRPQCYATSIPFWDRDSQTKVDRDM